MNILEKIKEELISKHFNQDNLTKMLYNEIVDRIHECVRIFVDDDDDKSKLRYNSEFVDKVLDIIVKNNFLEKFDERFNWIFTDKKLIELIDNGILENYNEIRDFVYRSIKYFCRQIVENEIKKILRNM